MAAAPTELLIIFTAAFLGSIGHCAGMCGGIVVAYSSSKLDAKQPWHTQSFAHLAYNFGRVTTYTLMGALFGLLGKIVAFTPTTRGMLFLLTGLLMLVAGISLLGNRKWLNSAELSITRHHRFASAFRYLMHEKSLLSFYLLGILNGIIPCGLVYAFAIFAASTSSMLWGALIMFVFGLGTIPTLFMLGHITKFLQRGRWRDVTMKIAALLVILYGGMTVYKGIRFIQDPEEMQRMLERMHEGSIKSRLEGKCGGLMKCAPGKCG